MNNETPRLFDIPEPMPTLADYDWIVVNTSAGKDSMAMIDYVCDLAEGSGLLHRVVAVHADLGRVEWQGTAELAEAQSSRYGVRFIKVWRKQGDLLEHIEARGMFPGPATRYCTAHHKQNQVSRVFTALTNESRAESESHLEPRDGDLLEQVEARGMWPDNRNRYCTSDQKRAQVHRVFTHLADATRQVDKGRPVKILNCMGMRADESPARAKKPAFARSAMASNGRRHVDDWLPLHRWSEPEVWTRIRASRAADLVHPAYGLGMPRLSCCFCIFAPKSALIVAGKHNPDLLAEYVRVEKKIGHTFRVDLSMAQVADAVAAGETPTEVSTWTM